ncbi:MAG TPA: rod shape-determining protein MreC [Candidatus Moranbacteria bacterium]|nr:MAG: Cell shape-determining protein MreC [Candidatus Moranbacteria bacterium GW2011_GWC2_45_10]KKT95030.1 MAG: rod shape-determining protein MreC, rod shape-determining protein MreC [Parcubacteria group bacterium GW2011_GWC1_45_14]HAV11519.1 rod shape-determining protein MreC [Candidatus Moranbacteria bacterium]
MKKFSSRKLFKTLAVVVIFGLLVFFNPQGFFNPFRAVFSQIAYPFETFSYSVSYKFRDMRDFLVSIGELKDENRRFIGENQALLAENAKLRDMERENAFLREQVGLLPRDKFDLEATFVISGDSQGAGNWLEINKGSDNGVREGMAVVVSKGILIGKVQQVFSNRSRVMLLSNPKSAVGIAVSQSGAKGIVKGEYGLGIVADSILQTDSVSIGNEVVTTGAGSDVPRGLLVGTVQQVRPSSDHLFQQAAISSPVDVSKLEAVFVIKANK